jgi:hypothetical protein
MAFFVIFYNFMILATVFSVIRRINEKKTTQNTFSAGTN